MQPTLKTGLWLVGGDLRVAVTRNTSGFDPKEVVGHVVKVEDEKWKVEGDNREYDSAESAADALIKAIEESWGTKRTP